MLRVVLQNLPRAEGLENLFERDVLFDHLLLGVLSDTDAPCRSEGTHQVYDGLEFSCIKLGHSSAAMYSKGILAEGF